MYPQETPRITNRIEAVTQSFLEQPQQSSYPAMVMVGIVVAAIAAAAAIYFLYRYQLARTIDDPKRLFHELCRAHGLSLGQKSTLMKLVKARKLANPNMVMLDANLWVLDPAQDAELCTPKLRSRLIHVHRLLFRNDG